MEEKPDIEQETRRTSRERAEAKKNQCENRFSAQRTVWLLFVSDVWNHKESRRFPIYSCSFGSFSSISIKRILTLPLHLSRSLICLAVWCLLMTAVSIVWYKCSAGAASTVESSLKWIVDTQLPLCVTAKRQKYVLLRTDHGNSTTKYIEWNGSRRNDRKL